MEIDPFDEPLIIETKEEAERLLKAIEAGEAENDSSEIEVDPEIVSTIKKIYHL